MIRILRKLNSVVIIAFYAALALGTVAIFSKEALTQTYPTKPIRIVSGTTAGSSSDIIARLISVKLTEAFGQQFIIDNRPGATGRIAAEVVARAAPDGYTLLMLTSSLTGVTAMYKDLNYDLVKDFSPISLVGRVPHILVVSPSFPAISVKELVALAKAKPGALKYGTAGSGSGPHLSAVVFKFMTGTDILHVPYKGGPAALTATMTGEVDMSFQNTNVCVPLIKSGKLRALGVTSAKRTTLVPDVPSISEAVPGYEWMGAWQSLVAPAKTPPAILAKLNAEVIKALNTSVVREQMAFLGNEPIGSSQQDLAIHISEQLKKMKELIKISGASPEN